MGIQSVDQAAGAAPLPQSVEDVTILLQYFERLDATDPLLRLLIAASVILFGFLLLLATRLLVGRRLTRLEAVPETRFKPLRVQAQDMITSEDMKNLWLAVMRWSGRALSLLSSVVIFTGVLMTSKWTMAVAARMIIFFVSVLDYLWSGFVAYLPKLFTLIIIIVIARLVVRTIGLIFEGIQSRRIHLKNFYPEWAETSFSLIRLGVYAMTAVIAFPYLPGSSSPAFQGISIFVGVLVSLGSTTAVANVVAGIVLTYTRAFQVGDQVEIADVRGRIVERSTFVTRIQTLKNVVVSIPNSMTLNNNIINYSKNLGQSGLLVHTGITIGYDVPWQTVNELLLAAARKTDNIVTSPEPFVLQTSLDDNYVSYEVNVWTRKPELLPKIYSHLHANILDEFHGHQVEITSPAYRAVRDGNAGTIPVASEETRPSSGSEAPA